MESSRLVELWPAAGVAAKAGDLELRWMDDELLVDLAELAGRGVHDPSVMPFYVPWTRGSAEEVARSVLAFHWSARSQVSPGRLRLDLGVLVEGRPVGIQGASGDDWAILRELETGSWLGKEFQGRGIGTRMRALMLHLCFEGLHAEHITSGAFHDNHASVAVSRRTGYEADGDARVVREGLPALQHRYRMSRSRWLEVRAANAAVLGSPVELAGLEPLLAQVDSAP